ncbi:MAG: hypothetical protein ACKO7D_06695, partial [Bacteroidota bacterium]
MKKLFKISSFLLSILVCVKSSAQISSLKDTVKFSYSIEQNECEAFLVVKVSVIPGWHVNAFNFGIPQGRSEIVVKSSLNFTLVGKIIEPKPVFETVDPDEEPSAYHKGNFTLKQKIIILSKQDFIFSGSLKFTYCGEGNCLRDSINFSVPVKSCNVSQDKIDSLLAHAPVA